ncbi:rhodopsin, GQ-coupled-like isoform X2 [Acanthaster planci]|uniref:Rhodopsin, GQ-coupled-like isoform X2 n=1 Tax=Acanthaster planci TaxID=133434 RepID=A0A8B7YHV0_ACAPL|nr:rhodopsin, GQ-coupled-like isoform X2 [Acanthaster planci]
MITLQCVYIPPIKAAPIKLPCYSTHREQTDSATGLTHRTEKSVFVRSSSSKITDTAAEMENTSWNSVSDFPLMGTTAPMPRGPPPMPPFLDYGLAFFLFVAFVFGIAGNGVTLWIFVRTKSLRTAPNMLIVNLAFSDISMIITNFPLMFASTIYGKWLFGDLVCEIYAFFGGLFGFMSIATMTAIALDRHYVICHSMEAMRTVTRRKAAYKILLVWIYSSIWSLLPFFGFGAYVLEGYGVSCTFEYLDLSLKNRLYVGTIFTFGFLIPLGVIIACYVHIAYTLRQHRLQLMRVQNDLRSPGNDKAQAAAIRKVKAENVEWQIAKVGIMLTILFCASWMPYASVAFIGEFIDASKVTPMVQVIPVVLAKSSASWNPLVYAISHQRFKEALRDHFFVYCCGESQSRRQRHSTTRSMSSENRNTDSRATSVRSVISEADKRDRTGTVMSTVSTKTDEIEMESGVQKPTRSSLKGGRERANKNSNNNGNQSASEQRRRSFPDTSSTTVDSGNVNLVMKSRDGVKIQEHYAAYDNPAASVSDREELTKL